MINENDYKPEVVELLHQPWTIEIRPYNDGGYFARVIELRGCMTEAPTQLEALQQLEEAQVEWLAAALEHGDPIPKPMGDSEFSGKIFVRTSPHLHRMVSEAALREGVSMSQWISEILSRAVAFQEIRLWFTQGDPFGEILEALRNASNAPGLVGPSSTATADAAKRERSDKSGREHTDVHVAPIQGGGWMVKSSGGEETSLHETKSGAVKQARGLARGKATQVVVHNRDGKISSKGSRSDDPRRSKS